MAILELLIDAKLRLLQGHVQVRRIDRRYYDGITTLQNLPPLHSFPNFFPSLSYPLALHCNDQGNEDEQAAQEARFQAMPLDAPPNRIESNTVSTTSQSPQTETSDGQMRN